MGSTEPGFLPLDFEERSPDEMADRAKAFHELMSRRRSVRSMSTWPVLFECITAAVRTAATAPSGANQQPWHFVIVDDAMLKREIREAAEIEEAPILIVVFKEAHGVDAQGSKVTHYYVNESVGIA